MRHPKISGIPKEPVQYGYTIAWIKTPADLSFVTERSTDQQMAARGRQPQNGGSIVLSLEGTVKALSLFTD